MPGGKMTILFRNCGGHVRVGAFLALLLAAGLSAVGSYATAATPVKRHPASVVKGTPMTYFRVSSLDQCNVYMNYSYFDEPKFQLHVLDPAALSPVQASFVEKFNAAFATMIHNHPDACSYQGSAYDMSGQTQQGLLERCLAQEATMGYSERGWQGGRLPAPTNCISYRDDMPGVINLLPRNLPTPPTTIEEWMKKADARH